MSFPFDFQNDFGFGVGFVADAQLLFESSISSSIMSVKRRRSWMTGKAKSLSCTRMANDALLLDATWTQFKKQNILSGALIRKWPINRTFMY